MRYLVISGYEPGRVNGITNYSRAVVDELRRQGAEAQYLDNRGALSPQAFRRHVAAEVPRRFDPRDTVIEAPEVDAPTALLDAAWRVHIRLHCPRAVAYFSIGGPVDLEKFASELEVAARAAVVSAPSQALLNVLAPYLDIARIDVFPNPAPFGVVPAASAGKDIDLLFMARFNKIKGDDDLQWLLPALAAERSVALLGRDFERFRMPAGVRARAVMHGFDTTPARFDLLRRARALLVLSRFENGPMLVLEAMAHGTPVVGWDVGGIGEIAGPPLVNLVPWGDRYALLAAIDAALEGPPPSAAAFVAATARLRRGFTEGLAAVRRTLAGATDGNSIRRVSPEPETLQSPSLAGFHDFCRSLRRIPEPVAAAE